MRCSNCGWDNADQNTRCEKCNSPLGNFTEDNIHSTIRETVPETDRGGSPYPPTEREPREEPVRPTAPESDHTPKTTSGYGETIGPGQWSPFGPFTMSYCKLTPMPLAPNQKHMPKELELKGEYNELNRGNLDPDNFTISQKVQAVLTCKNGKWYINDQSTYKTTFILVSEETPLKSGDVILMGNRRFVFTEE